MDTTTTTTPADELRTAAQRLRCAIHSFPRGSTSESSCELCGISAHNAWIAVVNQPFAQALAALLDDIAGEAERHAAHGMGNSQDEVADSLILNVARALNGGAA